MTNSTDTLAPAGSDKSGTSEGGPSGARGLSALKLAELQQMASGLGITGTGRMRKSQLVEAISAAGSGGATRSDRGDQGQSGDRRPPRRDRDGRSAGDGTPSTESGGDGSARDSSTPDSSAGNGARDGGQQPAAGQRSSGQGQGQGRDSNRDDGRDSRDSGRDGDSDRDDDYDRSGRRRRRRGRDRNRDRNDRDRRGEQPVSDDDVLIPVAGILDVLDSYAFVRTSGYLPGPNDVYVSLAMVRRNNLRKGDAVTGAVRQPREGEKQQKFNALVRVDTVNGADPSVAGARPDFGKLTPLYPQDRLRLESEPHLMTPRVIDLVAPIGKGQRGLIVSPPKAGKTMVLQAIANAITANNPECHLMVVLVDERPEEVTDMQRTVKGEVIASTFDRPADDHTTVAVRASGSATSQGKAWAPGCVPASSSSRPALRASIATR